MLLLLLAGWGTTEAKRHAKTDDVLNLVASYPALICSTPPDSFTTFSYAKVLINVDRRNLTLATAPTLFYLMHDNRRHFLSESYVRLTYHRDRDDVIEPLLYLSTIYNRHRIVAWHTFHACQLTAHIIAKMLQLFQRLTPCHNIEMGTDRLQAL